TCLLLIPKNWPNKLSRLGRVGFLRRAWRREENKISGSEKYSTHQESPGRIEENRSGPAPWQGTQRPLDCAVLNQHWEFSSACPPAARLGCWPRRPLERPDRDSRWLGQLGGLHRGHRHHRRSALRHSLLRWLCRRGSS